MMILHIPVICVILCVFVLARMQSVMAKTRQVF